MRKKIAFILCLVMVCSLLGACGKETSSDKEEVSLTVWCSKENKDILNHMADEFCNKYRLEADIKVHVGTEEEDELKKNLLSNLDAGADVFSFPDDQFYALASKGALLPITTNTEQIIAQNGGASSSAIMCATYKEQLCAYPMTATNGYFMFYDSRYFSDKDVKSLDRMLEVAAQNNKKLCMDWSSGWYIYSFFAGTGFHLSFNPDTMTNVCDWNKKSEKYKGTDVAKAMLDIAKSKAFYNGDSDKFKEGVKKGEIIAGVSGTWNVECVEKAYGQYYSACKLPTFTIKGEQEQMASFSGYKLVGVNATTDYPEWSQRFAEWITNEENQKYRFEMTGEGPSDKSAAASEEVRRSPAIAALTEQSKYSTVQNVGENFWDAATVFGTVMASGNKDKLDLQKLLDELVTDTQAAPKAE